MRYFSTFSGIGGFEYGLELAYISHQLADANAGQTVAEEALRQVRQRETVSVLSRDDGRERITHEMGRSLLPTDQRRERPVCVGYSEIDRYASSVYEHNFKGHTNYGDITKIDADELPDFDLLVGGFPCQAFSIAGRRAGFEDTRGTLFFDLARILRAKRPRLFVFENVKGLLSHDNGNTFKTIIATIDELGYDCQWQVLNSKNHGVPQNRERIYIVGHLRGTPRPKVFPIGAAESEDIIEGSGPSGALVRAVVVDHGKLRETEVSQALDANYYKGFDNHGQRSGVLADARVRRFTPKECERLQGFPDDWTAQSTNGPVSDTQRYKMCGNAVTTNVVRDIMERLLY